VADIRGMETFTEARRELGVTGEVEKRVLRWLAGRLPGWVQPDHLTALGLLSLVAGGVAYALTPRDLQWLHGVNLSLLLNWLGDSLDGTLARFRKRSRPRYGFYVDHLVDGFGAAALLTGLALSGLAHPASALALLVAYLLLSVEIALAAHATGLFRIARGPVGGTELRMLLALANLAALAWPRIRVLGLDVGFLDLITAPASVLVLALVLDAGWRNAQKLDALDRSALGERPQPDERGPSAVHWCPPALSQLMRSLVASRIEPRLSRSPHAGHR
jgi:phosphatidylglycerophosphate synthase